MIANLADIKSVIHYCPESGILTSKVKTKLHNIGDELGTLNSNGYRQLMVSNKLYLAHILIWWYMTEAYPDQQIDHINTIRDDNRWINLRLSTQSQNIQNASMYITNTSGVKGLSFDKARNRWQCAIMKEGSRIYKYFKEDEYKVAVTWITSTRDELHGIFANHSLIDAKRNSIKL